MSVRRECRVTRIDTYIVGAKWCNWVFAHVFTDDGIEGVGEGTCEFQPKAVEAAIQQLARRVVVGQSAFAIELGRRCHRPLRHDGDEMGAVFRAGMHV